MVEYDYEQINKQELIWEDNNMSRLGMLYALNEEDVKKLRSVPEEERYEYMLEEIEEALIGSPRSCELDKAWEGIQYCLGGGQWNEDNCIPTNIVFGGEVLVETDDEIITLKKIIKWQAGRRLAEGAVPAAAHHPVVVGPQLPGHPGGVLLSLGWVDGGEPPRLGKLVHYAGQMGRRRPLPGGGVI